jgi:hypothetical protein
MRRFSHEADAGARALIRRGAVDRLAIELDAAGLDRHEAHQALEQRRLAHAGHARHGLVEQQQLGALHQQHAAT